ncbi:MAG: hypothetical protein VST70_07970 [Nitrospirota bacterium]|nr:hypothetical protein [Nitrospirota bacterium]
MTDVQKPKDARKDGDPPLFLALLGYPSLAESAPRKFHLLLPDTQAERIDSRVAGARNTAFIVLLQAGLDLLKRRAEMVGSPLFVDADKEIEASGYGLNPDLSDRMAEYLAAPLKTPLPPVPCLSVEGRMGSLSRRPFALLLPRKLADDIDKTTRGPRNSVFVVLLSIGFEVYRRRALLEKIVPIVTVREFFNAQGYNKGEKDDKRGFS